jgi:hypothetical protein
MGQAHTIMSMEQLTIPDWFDLRTAADEQLWLRTLNEHETIVRRLTDSHSDEFVLLKQYRRIFQARREESDLELVNFLVNYGCLLFKKRAQGHWSLPQFRVASVTAILERNGNIRTLLRNPGFQAVSAAIRSATVGAQAARHNGKLDHREIRYGLLSEIRRAGESGRYALVKEALSFISKFNREGTERRSAGIPSAQIRSEEQEAFRRLAEELPAAVPAASILCVAATCLPGTANAEEVHPKALQAVSA